jgi:hypothetical protein
MKTKENRVSIRVKVKQLADIILIGGYHHVKEESKSSIKNITLIDISYKRTFSKIEVKLGNASN